jgi:broad specificity phosphatase PhoE
VSVETPLQRIVLVRHAETAWSLSGQHTGSTDLPLTEAGRQKVALAGRRLAGRRFTRVLTSPLIRAKETAQLTGFGGQAEVHAGLRHLLRALAVRWIGMPLTVGRLLELGTGSISTLGWKRELQVIDTWNDRAHLRAS